MLDPADSSYDHEFEQLVLHLPKPWNILEMFAIISRTVS